MNNRYCSLHLIWIITACIFLSSCKKSDPEVPESTSNLHFYLSDGAENVTKVKSTKNGDMVFVGESNEDAFILRIDRSGKVLWRKEIGGSKRDGFNNFIEASNGDLIAVGATKSKSNGFTQGYVLRFSSSGDVIWEKYFGYSIDNGFYGVVEDNSGNIIATGWQQPSSVDTWILKLSSSGNQIWEQIYSIGPYRSWGVGSTIGSDGNYVIAGPLSKSGIPGETNQYQNFIVCLYSDDGSPKWYDWDTSNYHTRGNKLNFQNKYNYDLHTTSNGFYLFTTFEEPGSKSVIQVIKYDDFGNLISDVRFHGLNNAFFNQAVKTSDGGFLVLGGTDDDETAYNLLRLKSKSYLLKLNSSLVKEWEAYHGGSGSLQRAHNGFYENGQWSIAGNSQDPVTLTNRLMIYQTDENGKLLTD